MVQFFETERLVVRGLEDSDLDAFAELCADPVAMQYLGDGSTMSREDVKSWIAICRETCARHGYGISAVVEKEQGQFIGFCGVFRDPDEPFEEMVYAFSQANWGKGYATEVATALLDYTFRISDLPEIYATLHHKNVASLRIMEKLGMEYVKSQNDEGRITEFYRISRNKP